MLDYRHQKQHAIRTKLIAISDSHITTKWQSTALMVMPKKPSMLV